MKKVIKLQDKGKGKLKKGGMHFLNVFVKFGEEVEVEAEEKDFKSAEFVHWFEVVGEAKEDANVEAAVEAEEKEDAHEDQY